MKIDPKKPIAGLRPAALKKLLRREHFNTVDAMRDLRIREPLASTTLRKLAAEDWVSFDGTTSNGLECWKTGLHGRRLVATKIIKRFPVAEGLALLPKVIAEAHRLNAERSSLRITSIWLFGSVLTGSPDDDAGDVDLVVNVARRPLSKDELAAIEAEEDRRAPVSQRGIFFNDHRMKELLRAIKKVSRRISVHVPSDVETLGLPYREIYRFDIDTDQRAEPAGDVAGRPSETIVEDQQSSEQFPAIEVFAPPVMPNEPVSLEDPVDLETLLLAQHFWTVGKPRPASSAGARLSEAASTAYLSQLAPEPKRRTGDVAQMLYEAVIRTDPNLALSFQARADIYGKLRVSLRLIDEDFEEVSQCHWFARSDAYFWGRPEHFGFLDTVSEAAWMYADKVFSTVPGIDRQMSYFYACEYGAPRPIPRPMSLKQFHQPLLDLAKTAQARTPNWDESNAVMVDFWRHRPLLQISGHRFGPGYHEKYLKKSDAPDLWRMAKAFADDPDSIERAGFRVKLSARIYD